ncbi:MAG: hypothetical protein IPJ79_14265 [Bacteroidetes bacterium]|nr:hypothetical protein [Bacteroidota bacterium]
MASNLNTFNCTSPNTSTINNGNVMLSETIFNLSGNSQKINDNKTSNNNATVNFNKSNIASIAIMLFFK